MQISISTRVLSAVLCLFAAGWLFASPTGSVTGFVRDASGAVVPGAKVTLTNTATNAQLTITTDPNGEFQFPQLAPAGYTLVVEARGFKRAVSSATVQVDQITHAEFNLEVGDVSQSVQVEAAAPLLETDKSTMSSVVDTRTIANMPLNARQYLDLALLTPGALPSQPGQQGGGFNMAGARSQSNAFMLDGVNVIDTQVNSALGNFRITDAVQEFAVQTSVPTAEFGRGQGAQVSIVSKSGSNQFHGSVFEYLRNSDFDATDFFTNRAGTQKNPLHRNQYGATLGGPIWKDKTFFFLSWEGFRQVNPQPSSTRVPTDAERAQVTDPISRALLQFWPKPDTTPPPGSVNNFIANVGASTFDNTGLVKIDQQLGQNDHVTGRWAEFEGSATTAGVLPGLGGTNNVPISRSGVLIETHTFSPNLLNEFRFGFARNQTYLTVTDSGFNAATIFKDVSGNPLPGVVDGSKNLLDSGLPTITVSGGYAVLGTANNYPQGRVTNTYELFDNLSWVAPFGASKHSFRWGYHVRREDARRFLDGSFRGTFNILNWSDFSAGLINTSTFHTGTTMAYWRRYPFDFYWQDTYKMKDNITLNYGIRYEYPSAIYQTRKQATNFIPGAGAVLLGTNQLLAVDPTKKGFAALTLSQAPFTLSDSGVNSDKNNFAPVVGLAYTPRFAEKIFGHDATVIRTGFRVGFDDIFNNIPANMGLNVPYSLTTNQNTGTQGGKFPWATGFNQNVPLISNFGKQGPGTPTSGLVSISAEDPNLRSAYIYQYNFGIQRKMGNSFSFEADYQGSSGHKLLLNIDLNEPTVIVNNPAVPGKTTPNQQFYPYPGFSAISMGKDLANSHYNGLILTGKWQGGHGIYFQGTYTFSKSIDDSSSWSVIPGQPGGVADGRNLRLEYGPSNFNIPHRAVFTYVMDLPVGPGHRLFGWNNLFNRELLGGWQISGITTIQSGSPFTPYNSSNDFSGFNGGNGTSTDRLDIVGTGKLRQNNRNVDAAFDTTYYNKTPPTGRVGTAGRDQYYGPGLANYDFSAAKHFALGTERMRLQLRADFFNIFNHTNFSNPVTNASNANFGKITSTVGSAVATAVGTSAGLVGGGPRIIQFAMRLQF